MESIINIIYLLNNYLIIITDHARVAMLHDDTSEEEIERCLERGYLKFKEKVKGEMRYAKQIDFKNKSILVVFTYRNNEERIITTYKINKKKWQK